MVELKVGRNLIGDRFGGVIVSEIQAEGEVAAERVVGVKLLRADDVFFAAEPEEFTLYGVDAEFAINLGVGENRVVGVAEALAWRKAIGRDVFGAIGDPVVVDARAL